MKNLGIFCLLLAFIGLESCKKEQKPKDNEASQVQAENPVSVECYKALYEKDTVELKINTLKDGKISGNMMMKVFSMPKKTGKINGEFRGDTLFVDYGFYEENNDKKQYKNPMAFLKREKELILGNAKIETYMGASYLSKDVPIDFDRVKYKFTIVDCVDK